MAGFWEHYAQANDEIRTKLIDEGWFQQRGGSNAMQSDVNSMTQAAEQPAGYLETAEVYDPKEVYGEDMSQPETQDIYGEAQAQEPAQANDLYGYDALEEDEAQTQTQRL